MAKCQTRFLLVYREVPGMSKVWVRFQHTPGGDSSDNNSVAFQRVGDGYPRSLSIGKGTGEVSVGGHSLFYQVD